MPLKLQIKLLSSHGELLNVVTCHAGQISVFRANSPADLKPYHRALTGAHGPERFSINVDGREYAASDHILIGFGERLPPGLSVTSLLESAGVPASSVQSLLLSYGLDHLAEKDCSSVSEDEKRRLQLLSAVYHPERVLILNEPFDSVSSSWKERFADLLAGFARQKKAIVLVVALSYRPECWIDNESVTRIQVGESLQRTVGFSGSGADIKDLVAQIRDSVRSEGQTTQIPPTASHSNDFPPDQQKFQLPGFSEPSKIHNLTSTEPTAISEQSWFNHYGPIIRRSAPIWGALGALALGFILIRDRLPGDGPAPVQDPTIVAANSKSDHPAIAVQPTPNLAEIPAPDAPPSPPEMSPSQFVLEEYPEEVRISLLDTMNGVISIPASDHNATAVQPAVNVPSQPQNGNIFKLLESANSQVPDRPGDSPFGGPVGVPGEPPLSPESYSPPPPMDEAEEQAKREAIRQKFLEAIRAAAERRAAESQY